MTPVISLTQSFPGMLLIVAAFGATGLAVLVALEVYQARLPHTNPVTV